MSTGVIKRSHECGVHSNFAVFLAMDNLQLTAYSGEPRTSELIHDAREDSRFSFHGHSVSLLRA